jgi:hypothetical protein
MCAIGHQPDRQYNKRERKKKMVDRGISHAVLFSFSLLFRFVREKKTDTEEEGLSTDNNTTK